MLGYFFLLHLILFKYHLFTFKCTHSIIFKTQEYLCLAIFEKPMIQVHDKIILSMGFKSIIKAHDLNPWQFIHSKPNSHWQHQSSILIGNIKTQFLLGLLYQKEKKPKIINAWQRKNIMVKMLPWQKRPWQSSYEKKNSLKAILRIMFSYYKPMEYMDIICITTSIIYTFNARGKTFKPTSSSFKLLETMNIAIWNSS